MFLSWMVLLGGADGDGGSRLPVGYPAQPGPGSDRMQGSQALQPPLLGPFPMFRGICGGPCDATVISSLS